MENFWKFIVKNKEVILQATYSHIKISSLAVIAGIIIAVPLGIWLTRHKNIAEKMLAVLSVLQTIPSMVFFGLAMPITGIGFKTALMVLILYSILPILRNTYTGISEVPGNYTEAAKGMGMNGFQMLTKVELPIALPVIVGGVRISTTYIISWATVAAMIGGGGLGDLIYTGIQTYNYKMILIGAIPSCILALVASSGIGFIEKLVTPKGFRTA